MQDATNWAASLTSRRLESANKRQATDRPQRELSKAIERVSEAFYDHFYAVTPDPRCINPGKFTTEGIEAMATAVADLCAVLVAQDRWKVIVSLPAPELESGIDEVTAELNQRAWRTAHRILVAGGEGASAAGAMIEEACADVASLLGENTWAKTFAFRVQRSFGEILGATLPPVSVTQNTTPAVTTAEVNVAPREIAWHPVGTPDPDGTVWFGPLSGTKQYIADCMGERYARRIDDLVTLNALWGRKEKRTLFTVWFKNQKQWAAVNAKLIELRSAKKR